MKRFVTTSVRAAFVGLLFVFASCRDASAPTAPVSTAAVQQQTAQASHPDALLGIDLGGLPIVGGLLNPDTVTVLQRLEALPNGVTTTKIVGSAGGVITLPAAGLTVSIPAGALVLPTPITVTAKSGRGVAYDFGPAGTKFAKPVTLTQDLSGTVVGSPALLQHVTLNGGYFKSDTDLLTSLLRAVVSELLPATTNTTNLTVKFDVSHFSGYLVAVN